jgi:hypothetical protein
LESVLIIEIVLSLAFIALGGYIGLFGFVQEKGPGP